MRSGATTVGGRTTGKIGRVALSNKFRTPFGSPPPVPGIAEPETTTPAADFCAAVRVNRFTLSHASVTHSRSPVISTTAFHARPPDLPPVPLMDMGFAICCLLARHRRPHHPVFVHRPACLLHASFRPRLATTPLRFAITSPPSGCEEDFHLQAVEHARHTTKTLAANRGQGSKNLYLTPQTTDTIPFPGWACNLAVA